MTLPQNTALPWPLPDSTIGAANSRTLFDGQVKQSEFLFLEEPVLPLDLDRPGEVEKDPTGPHAHKVDPIHDIVKVQGGTTALIKWQLSISQR